MNEERNQLSSLLSFLRFTLGWQLTRYLWLQMILANFFLEFCQNQFRVALELGSCYQGCYIKDNKKGDQFLPVFILLYLAMSQNNYGQHKVL